MGAASRPATKTPAAITANPAIVAVGQTRLDRRIELSKAVRPGSSTELHSEPTTTATAAVATASAHCTGRSWKRLTTASHPIPASTATGKARRMRTRWIGSDDRPRSLTRCWNPRPAEMVGDDEATEGPRHEGDDDGAAPGDQDGDAGEHEGDHADVGRRLDVVGRAEPGAAEDRQSVEALSEDLDDGVEPELPVDLLAETGRVGEHRDTRQPQRRREGEPTDHPGGDAGESPRAPGAVA